MADDSVEATNPILGSLKVSGSNVNTIFTVAGFGLLMFLSFVIWNHHVEARDNDKNVAAVLKENNKIIADALKENTEKQNKILEKMSDQQQKTVDAIRESNCLLGLPQERSGVLQEDKQVKLGEKGAALIKSYEQCKLDAYKPTPDDVPTIGWGHTRNVAMGDTCNSEQADAWFLQDVAWVEDCVNRAVTSVLTQSEFDALASLCFNIGCRAFSGSTLVKRLNNADYEVGNEFAKWNKQNGKELAGLTKRREAEAALFEETA